MTNTSMPLMRWRCLLAFLSAILLTGAAVAAPPLETGFSYQGRVTKGGSPISTPCDFQFTLYDASGGGTKIGSTQTVTAVAVLNGLFTVVLNRNNEFGSGAFTGSRRWLMIAVRNPAGSGTYTALSPRQELTATPYALTFRGGARASNTATAGWTTGLKVESLKGIGIHGTSQAKAGEGLRGENTAAGNAIMALNNNPSTTDTAGLWGESTGKGSGVIGVSQTGFGVYGFTCATGSSMLAGVTGVADQVTGVLGVSQKGYGVFGRSDSFIGVSGYSRNHYGVSGSSTNNCGISGDSEKYYGVYGHSGKAAGVFGEGIDGAGLSGTSTKGYGVLGISVNNHGVFGSASNGVGVLGKSDREGVRGESTTYAGVLGTSTGTSTTSGTGVMGRGAIGGAGVWGIAGGSSSVSAFASSSVGVRGDSANGLGVVGTSKSGIAIYGKSTASAGYGVFGESSTGTGVRGFSSRGVAVSALVDTTTGTLFLGTFKSSNIFNPYPAKFRVESTGRVSAAGSFVTTGKAVATRIQTSGSTLPAAGDVVEIDPTQTARFRLTSTPFSRTVAGVVTNNPALVTNDAIGAELPADSHLLLATSGRTMVKVTAASGGIYAIKPGDMLVSSGTPGYAMRATDDNPPAGIVIGKSLGFLSSGTGTIEMLVMLR